MQGMTDKEARDLVGVLEALPQIFRRDPKALELIDELNQRPAALQARLKLAEQRSQELLLIIGERDKSLQEWKRLFDERDKKLQGLKDAVEDALSHLRDCRKEDLAASDDFEIAVQVLEWALRGAA